MALSGVLGSKNGKNQSEIPFLQSKWLDLLGNCLKIRWPVLICTDFFNGGFMNSLPNKSNNSVFGSGSSALARNTVLRNTYWLLALSLVPTVLGAWVGLTMGFSQLISGSPFISVILFLGVSFGFFYVIEKFKTTGVGVALLLAFTFFMGVWLSMLIGRT